MSQCRWRPIKGMSFTGNDSRLIGQSRVPEPTAMSIACRRVWISVVLWRRSATAGCCLLRQRL
jgi:hypothetical protein